MLAFLLAGGDDEPGGDVAQAQLLAAEVKGDGEHGVVGDGGAADRLAAGAGRLVATRAVVLAAGWLTRERGADVVELRAGRDSPACQRIAVKSGFALAGTVSSVAEATGTVVEDLRYITEAGEHGGHPRAAS